MIKIVTDRGKCSRLVFRSQRKKSETLGFIVTGNTLAPVHPSNSLSAYQPKGVQ